MNDHRVGPPRFPRITSRLIRAVLTGVVLASAGLAITSLAFGANGFDLTDSLVPPSQIQLGGPPRDGIPAIDTPSFVTASEVVFLHPDDRVLGLTLFGYARAYWFAWYAFHPNSSVFEAEVNE
jgi:hypothetical protein